MSDFGKITTTKFQKLKANYEIFCMDCSVKNDLTQKGIKICDHCMSGSNWDGGEVE